MLGTSSPLDLAAQMRRRELLTASPAQLTLKLFQRLVLDLHRADAELAAGRHAPASSHLLHAQAILTELDATLDVRVWDGARDLKAVYAYCLAALAQANRTADASGVTSALELLTPVAAAFEEAARTAPAPAVALA